MVANVESRDSKFDNVLWGVAIVLLVSGIGSQYYFATESLLLRSAGMLMATGVAIALVVRTAAARRFLAFWQESVVELRKVVWPTRKETTQSTIAVVAMVFVMGLVLWSIDAVLVRVMAWVIKGAV